MVSKAAVDTGRTKFGHETLAHSLADRPSDCRATGNDSPYTLVE